MIDRSATDPAVQQGNHGATRSRRPWESTLTPTSSESGSEDAALIADAMIYHIHNLDRTTRALRRDLDSGLLSVRRKTAPGVLGDRRPDWPALRRHALAGRGRQRTRSEPSQRAGCSIGQAHAPGIRTVAVHMQPAQS